MIAPASAGATPPPLWDEHMFRLLRTLILVMFAFIAGMLFEREGYQTICEDGGGLWIENICVGPEFD